MPVGEGGARPRRQRRAADGEVGRKVLEQVAHPALDQQADKHSPFYVAVGVDGLGAERGDRLEPYKQEDGDRRLVQHVDDAVGDDHVDSAGPFKPSCGLAVGQAEPDEQHAHQHQAGDLDHIYRYGGHGRPVDAPVGDIADDAGKGDGHDG